MLNVRQMPHQKGVTLIELMIALVILAVLMAIAFPNFSAWIQSTQIRNAAESIQNGLQIARNEAVRRNTQVTFTFTALPAATWSVDVVAPASNVQSHFAAEGSANAQVAAAPAGVVTFNGLGRVTPAAAYTFAISNPTGGLCTAAGGPMRCLNVTVAVAGTPGGGLIRMCDPALNLATNPQGCN